MVNYYKILGIENYSSLTDIKTAYKHKIRQYHPDINPDKEATEISKYLNVAKEALESNIKKTAYDKQLKLAYLLEIQRLKSKPKRSYWRSLSKTERIQRMEDAKKLKVKRQYEQSLKSFPLALRITGMVVLILWGLQLFYSHYFVLFNTIDMIYNFLGIAVFGIGIWLAANQIYTHYLVKSINQALRFNYEKFTGWFFILCFVLGPLSVVSLNNVRKSYHLSNHFEYYQAKVHIKKSSFDKVVISYNVDGQLYVRRFNYPLTDIFNSGKNSILIKYAKVDPRISEIVLDPTDYRKVNDSQ